MASIALDGNAHHFDETLFSVKPHPGMQRVAARERDGSRLQDRYSIRCVRFPHYIVSWNGN
jgi:histidine ammonia-lyase